MNDKVQRISSNLRGTTRNLQSLDHMLETYKDAGREQKSAIDKLRADLSKTCDDLKEERHKNSMLASHDLRASDLNYSPGAFQSTVRGYDSDVESPTSRHRRRRAGSVRFADDMNTELHSIHQSVRDVSHDQSKLENSFSHEMDRRDMNDTELRRSLRDVADGLRHTSRREPMESTVDRRLHALQNEIKADRSLMDRRYDEVGSISSDLKQALQHHQTLLHRPPATASPTSHTLDDFRLQKYYLETDALRHKVENDLDHMKRQLDQSEGSKAALSKQIEEMKSDLSRAETEKCRLKAQIEESRSAEYSRDRENKRQLSDEWDRDRNRLQAESQDLRSQLTKSLSVVSQFDDLRRDLDRSEKQRSQLSDHIQVLTKDIEDKEKQNVKLIGQLKDACDKGDQSDREKQHMFVQLEDALMRLRDISRDSDRSSGELREIKQSLESSEKRRDEFKARAQDTVKQWKTKCRQLQDESEELKRHLTEMRKKSEQLKVNMDGSRDQAAAANVVLERLQAQLADTMNQRASLESIVRQKEDQLADICSIKIELEGQLRDAKINNDKFEHELTNRNAHLTTLSNEKAVMEDQLSHAQAGLITYQERNSQLQSELSDMKRNQMEISSEITEAKSHIYELKQELRRAMTREQSQDEELNSLKNNLSNLSDTHKTEIEDLNKIIDTLNAHHEKEIQELSVQVKQEISDYEKEIDHLRVELEKEKMNTKWMKQTDAKLHKEMQRLHDEIQKYEEDKVTSQLKFDKLQQDGEIQSQKSIDDLQILQSTESELFSTKEQLRRQEEQYQTLIDQIQSETDDTIGALAHASRTPYKDVTTVNADEPYQIAILSSIYKKISWLKHEISDQKQHEKKLHKDLLDAINVNEKDRNFFTSQILRKEEKLDELNVIKEELLVRDDKNTDAVVLLNEKLKDMSDQLHIQKLKEQERINDLIVQENKDTEIEKANIEERYKRLKETMRQLQDDLRDTKLTSTSIPIVHTSSDKSKLPPAVTSPGNIRKKFSPAKKQKALRSPHKQ